MPALLIKYFLPIAAISGFIAVALGAIGAHGLENTLTPKALATFETAVRYQFYHTLALLMTTILLHQQVKNRWLLYSALFFIFGLFAFCGGLYFYAFTATTVFAHVAPIGGIAFLGGWLCLFIAALKHSAGVTSL